MMTLRRTLLVVLASTLSLLAVATPAQAAVAAPAAATPHCFLNHSIGNGEYHSLSGTCTGVRQFQIIVRCQGDKLNTLGPVRPSGGKSGVECGEHPVRHATFVGFNTW